MRALALVLLCLASPVWAGEVTVRSGEHVDFSRLVLVFETQVDWRFGRSEAGYEFRSGRADDAYALGTVFDLIPRRRIAEVQDLGEGRLLLTLGCDCHADAFELRDNRIVLDIKDGPPDALSAFETPLEPDGPAEDLAGEEGPVPTTPEPIPEAATRAITGASPGARVLAGADAPVAATARLLPIAPSDPLNAPYPVAAVDVPPEPESADPDPASQRVRETEAALLEQISRAAAQGLLEADLPEIDPGAGVLSQPISPVDPPAAPPALPDPEPPVTPESHVAIETAIDRDARETGPRPDETLDGGACLDDRWFAIADWGEDLTWGAELGPYRSTLLGEFDQADPASVTALTRYYIYLTFGAEAEALVRRYQVDLDRPDLLISMAQIMDTGQAGNAAYMVDQLACDGAVALWAALAQPRLYAVHQIDRQAITLAFSALPAHLRRHLGPGLAEKFLEAGDRDMAETLRVATARAGGDLGLLDARMAADQGRIDPARAGLSEIARSETDESPEALLELVALTIEAGEPVGADEIALLQSFGFQMAGSETGKALAAAEVRAHASRGDFAQGLARLEMSGLAPEVWAGLEADLLEGLTQTVPDAAFLRLVVPDIARAQRQEVDLRRAVAARLIDLGFAAPARAVLGGEGALPQEPDRMLFARAALLEGRPEIAVGYLAGIAGDEAERLRATAMALAADHAGAAQRYASVGDSDAQAREAWRAGDWAQVAEIAEGVLRDGAAAMTAPAPAPLPTDGGELAASENLLSASRETRALLADLMQSLPAP